MGIIKEKTDMRTKYRVESCSSRGVSKFLARARNSIGTKKVIKVTTSPTKYNPRALVLPRIFIFKI